MSAQKRYTPLAANAVEPASCTPGRRLEILRMVPLFKNLTPPQLEEVSVRFQAQSYAAGESIYHAGDPAQQLCVLATGKVKLLRYSASGQEVLLDLLVPGEFFGSLTALGDEAYQDSAVAQTDCCVLVMQASTFEEILSAYPLVTRAALELTASRLRIAQETIRQLGSLSVEQRLAATLLKLGEKLGEKRNDGLLLQVPFHNKTLRP